MVKVGQQRGELLIVSNSSHAHCAAAIPLLHCPEPAEFQVLHPGWKKEGSSAQAGSAPSWAHCAGRGSGRARAEPEEPLAPLGSTEQSLHGRTPAGPFPHVPISHFLDKVSTLSPFPCNSGQEQMCPWAPSTAQSPTDLHRLCSPSDTSMAPNPHRHLTWELLLPLSTGSGPYFSSHSRKDKF